MQYSSCAFSAVLIEIEIRLIYIMADGRLALKIHLACGLKSAP
jgi:hypothetical protein